MDCFIIFQDLLENGLKARFSGTCSECNEPIRKGREIAQNSHGKWVHKACSDVEEELP